MASLAPMERELIGLRTPGVTFSAAKIPPLIAAIHSRGPVRVESRFFFLTLSWDLLRSQPDTTNSILGSTSCRPISAVLLLSRMKRSSSLQRPRGRVWTGMTDQPNQNSPEESPDPTHLQPAAWSNAGQRYAMRRAAEPGTACETAGLSRKVTSPATETYMKWCRQNQREGTKMQVEMPPRTKVCTMCTPPLAGQTRDEWTLPNSQQAVIRGRSSKTIRLGHVVTTTPGHERVRATNWHRRQQKDDT
jgi:hypothetical protein